MHTPGPWTAVPQNDGSAVIVHRYDIGGNALRTRLICHVTVNDAFKKEAQENIRLISECPQLLWALKRIMQDLPRRRDWLDPEVEQIAKETLAKIQTK